MDQFINQIKTLVTGLLCLCVMILMVTPFCHATQIMVDDPVSLYEEAKQAYYNHEYLKAEDIFYNLAEPLGLRAGYLHYNLGNTYFNMGKNGRALQHYEKALLTLPRYPDLLQNLELLRSKLTDTTGESFSDYLLRTFYFWSVWLSYFEFQWLFIVFTVLFWGIFLWRRLRLKPLFGGIFLSLTVVYAYFVFGYHLKCDRARPGEFGIVLVPEVEVKASYLEKEKPIFVLHEGTKVRLIDRQELGKKKVWIRVALPEGQKGWVRENTIGRI